MSNTYGAGVGAGTSFFTGRLNQSSSGRNTISMRDHAWLPCAPQSAIQPPIENCFGSFDEPTGLPSTLQFKSPFTGVNAIVTGLSQLNVGGGPLNVCEAAAMFWSIASFV